MRLQSRKKGWLMAFLFGSALVLQGCLNNDMEDTYDYYGNLQKDFVTLGEYVVANGLDVEVDSVNGIFYKIHKKGDGYRTISGIDLEAHYQGFTLEGVEFANTFSGSPTTFQLGNGQTFTTSMTSGVPIAISLMQEGDSATFYFPAAYGFQDQSYQDVPPNSILVYNVKFVDVKNLSEEHAEIDQYIAENNMVVSIDSIFGTRYAIHRKGNTVTPDPGAQVSVHYQGELLDGTVFDNSYDRGSPLNITFGSGEVIKGFEMGLDQLHENDSATIFIPSIYGYGDAAQGDAIPANSILVFGLEVLRISNPI